MEKSDVVEEFYGVYLLKCLNPKYKGRTYIGYTVDPNRRIKQHNKGKLYGGAWKTSQKGPWEMTLTIHGFPSDVAALRFEWAWQHPKRSRRLKSKVSNKKSSESSFDYCLRVMFTMLTVPPWCRLPLTIRWLSPDVVVEPPPNLTPPVHMPIVYGPVTSQKLKTTKKVLKNGENANEESEEFEFRTCQLCKGILLKEDTLLCLNTNCDVRWHVLCLGRHFLENEVSQVSTQSEKSASKNILPVEGSCPECESVMLWGDIVRKRKGCYSQVTIAEENVTDTSY